MRGEGRAQNSPLKKIDYSMETREGEKAKK